MRKLYTYIFLFTFLICSCHRKSIPGGTGAIIRETGYASFYSDRFDGSKTSNGEVFRQNKATAAHKKLPFGTMVKVTNLSNDKSVIVRINDRGPFISGRIIDLSRSAASQIDMINAGIVKVRIEYRKQ
jgi:rare lipoprotein A